MIVEALRLARPGDANAIAVMSRDLVENGLGWSFTPEKVRAHVKDEHTLTVVAEAGSRIVGFAIVHYGSEVAHLSLLAVEPSHQRTGLGGRLMAWHLKCCQSAQVRAIRLELRADNVVAHMFYRAHGFVEAGVVSGYYAGVETSIQMQLMMPKA